MFDSFGTKVKEGSLVIKSIPNSSGAYMTIGVIKGKSVYYLCGIYKHELSRCAIKNVYVLVNPTDKEKEYKAIIEYMIANKLKWICKEVPYAEKYYSKYLG